MLNLKFMMVQRKTKKEKIFTGKVEIYGGLENHQLEMLMVGLKAKIIQFLSLNQLLLVQKTQQIMIV